jgi:hypothetical protein
MRSRRLLLMLVFAVASLVELKLFVPTAHAIIGMPFTPMSYAGVARRTTRRAYVYGAAASPYGYGYPYAAPPPAPYPRPAPYPYPSPYASPYW